MKETVKEKVKENVRVTPQESYTAERHEYLTVLHARLDVITKNGGYHALREEIRRILFDVSNITEGTVNGESYHLLGKKVTTTIARLQDVMEILNELRRQGASDT